MDATMTVIQWFPAIRQKRRRIESSTFIPNHKDGPFTGNICVDMNPAESVIMIGSTFCSAQTVILNMSAAALMIHAFIRRDQELRNISILVTVIGIIKVFFYDFFRLKGLPIVFSVLSFGITTAIESVKFHTPVCAIYQNVVAKAVTRPDDIKQNLIDQLTGPVRWTQLVQAMIADGATKFTEVGPGKVLQGLVLKIDKTMEVSGVA